MTSTIKMDSGDIAWVLISSALVLLMTPGLAFFYGGMVRAKNVVSTLFQSWIAIGVVSLIWALCGYSLVFSGDHFGLIGDLKFLGLQGVGQTPNVEYAPNIPHLAFMLFQAMFAVITPALITGAFAERIRFKAWILMCTAWSLLVYIPVAHWVWGNGGWIHKLGTLDFADGIVVHITAGFSALVAAVLFRKRTDFGKSEIKYYDSGMILLGAALLWFGWFGFNAGSALGANGLAAQAFATTFFAGAASLVSWLVIDVFRKGKASAIGAAVGAVAGLVAITPAAGYVTPAAAIAIGLITGVVCNYSVTFMKEHLKLDDSLDVFGCHGVGGILGTLLTGVFASKAVNPGGADGLFYGNASLVGTQLLGATAVVAYAMVITFGIIKAIQFFMPIQLTESEEEHGLDSIEHNEWVNFAWARDSFEIEFENDPMAVRVPETVN